MFPPAHHTARLAPRSMWAAFHHAVDLAVAFVTLESYGLDDLRPTRGSDTRGQAGVDPRDAAGDTEIAPGAPAASVPTAPELHALHRRELRTHARARRPGTTIPREQLCLSDAPVKAMPSSAPTQHRRTAPQDVSP